LSKHLCILASTGKYDAVFCGHTHKPSVEKIGKTLLANLGEVHGSQGKCFLEFIILRRTKKGL